jgi:hypothetical protein
VVFGWEMFSEVVGKDFVARAPVHTKLTLLDSIADPVKAHVDGVADDSSSITGVVDLSRGWGLRPTKFFASSTDRNGILSIVKTHSNFSLGCRDHDVVQNVDGTI